jgi:hypothetical protein
MSATNGKGDKTVEFKAITSYKKNVNILNKLGYENSLEFKSLINFLKDFKLDKEDRTLKPNVTSNCGRYLIPDDARATTFFSMLSNCNNKKIALHFREMQVSDIDNEVGSGVMIDFDIYQDSNKNPLDTSNCQDLCSNIIQCLASMLEIEDKSSFKATIAVIVKPRIIHIKEKGLFKNGIHILIPDIWITREQKKMFINHLSLDEGCKEQFFKIFNIPMSSALDTMCASVPVYFLHNCKEDSTEPYILKELYSFKKELRRGEISN